MESYELTADDGTKLTVRVHPETVPTTASPFHPSATHKDALGMPVAFTTPNPDWPEDKPWPYHPTPCCGAAASISTDTMFCKACYDEVDPAFGNFPVEPYQPLT